MFLAAPLVHDGVVYAPSQDGYVYALDARTGAMFWRAFAGSESATDSAGFGTLDSPVAIYRNVLFATQGDSLFAFDIRARLAAMALHSCRDGELTSALISDGLVVIGAADNHIYAVNP